MQVILQQKKGPANSSPRISNYDAQSNSVLHRQIHRLESFRNPEMLLCTVWAYPLPQGLVAALESVVTSSSDVSAVPDEICDSSGTIVVALSSLSTARNSSVGLSGRSSCTWKVKPEKHMGEKAEVAAEFESDGKEVRKKLSPKIVENAEGDPGWADDTGGKWKGVSLEKNGREGIKSKTYEVGSSLWGSASLGIMKILRWNVPSRHSKSPEDDQNSRRKTIIVQSYESSSPGQYNGRSKSQDLASEYFYNDKDDDDDDHWESNEYASEEHHQSRSKSTCDDKDQFIGKSNSHNKHSSEHYNERRSRGSS